MPITGAQIALECLKREGVELVFGYPGGANIPLYDALYNSPIRHILVRHEQGAAFAAEGYARATGQPGVCLATSGPGATNLVTGIADAKLDGVPLVCITGQVRTSLIGTDAFQEIDTYGLTIPVTKHNFLVRDAGELLETIPEAFRIAASGRPGPVLVDVPKDVQNQVVDFERWPEPGEADPPPRFEADEVDCLVRMIRKARRPIFYIGGGIIASGASDVLRRISRKATIPVTSTLMGLGAMPSDHPLFLGMLGMHAARYTNLALEECDLLIAAGVRFDDRATGKATQFCPEAAIVHIDIDGSELGKIKRPALGIEADVGQVLRAAEAAISPDARNGWRSRIEEMRRDFPLDVPGDQDPLQPYGLILQTASHLDDGAIITTDVGQHQMWAAQVYPLRRPRQWLTSGGLGTMGFGLPASIGAAIAEPDRKVVCFSGDGSLFMNIQELATAAEENVNVKVIVMNNAHLGLVRQQQHLFYGGRYSGARFLVKTDFVRIARGFGLWACDLGTALDPGQALRQALDQPGPCVVNVPIEAGEMVFPMVPPGAANREMICRTTAEGGTYARARA